MAARKPKPTTEEAAVPSFETAMQRLATLVEELEDGDLSLEDSLERFEEGVKLARASQARLDEAEARVEELLGEGDDGPITEELDVP